MKRFVFSLFMIGLVVGMSSCKSKGQSISSATDSITNENNNNNNSVALQKADDDKRSDDIKSQNSAVAEQNDRSDEDSFFNSQRSEKLIGEFPKNLDRNFKNCGQIQEQFELTANKHDYAQDKLRVADNTVSWSAIENNYPVSLLKVSADKDANAELQKKVKQTCQVVRSATADNGVVVQFFHCFTPDQWVTELSQVDTLDLYVGVRSPKDQMMRIYQVEERNFTDSEHCGSSFNRCFLAEEDAVFLENQPFLDTTAVYVRFVATENYHSDYAFAQTKRNITLAFAGDKHRYIGSWLNTIYFRSDSGSTYDEDGVEWYENSCRFEYTENTATFDGQIKYETTRNYGMNALGKEPNKG